jgi:hypothetical protein
MTNLATLLRLSAVSNVLSGVAHLLAPGLLVRAAQTGYDRVLAVDFEPRENTTRRVRLLGVLSLLAGWLLWRAADAIAED